MAVWLIKIAGALIKLTVAKRFKMLYFDAA
jgi:hypothetical protein